MTAPAIRAIPRLFSSCSLVVSRSFARTRCLALGAGSRLACLAILVGLAALPLTAQMAYLTSGSRITLGSGFLKPGGVAVDASGNVFVADTGNNAVKEIVAAGGYTTVNNLASGSFNSPQSLALDAYGNIFVADTGNNAVKVITAASGYTTVSTVESSSALIGMPPTGVAIDPSGNLWVAGPYTSSAVGFFEFLALSGYTTNPVALSTTSSDPTPGIVVASNNAFIGAVSSVLEVPVPGESSASLIGDGQFNNASGLAIDTSGNLFVADTGNNAVQEILAAGGYNTIVPLGSGFNQPHGVAVDALGNVFVADTGNNAVVEIPAPSAGGNFGTVSVNTKAPPTSTYDFVFTSGGTILAPAVLTQGAAGEDFTDAGTGTCTTNGTSHIYAVDETCTVDVTFTPKHPGTRYGAIQLLNSSGASIVTAPVYGTGSGPQITFAPGTQSTVGSGFNAPHGVAVDGSGNVVVGDTGNNAVKEILATTVRTLGSGFSTPQGVAVDGAANVFVADTGNNAVKEIVAADGVIPASPTINILGSGFNAPTGVYVDQSGNVIVNDAGNGVVKEILAASGYTTVTTLGGSFTYPVLQATDASGNVFTADTANDRVLKMDYADTPQLSFAPTVAGSTSVDSPQTVTVNNIGNAVLTFPIPSTGNNASISSGFALSNGGTCPELSSSSFSAATVAAGANCTYLVSFSPPTSGSYNGSLVLTDNNLYAGLTQTLALNGTTLNSQSISFSPPASPVTFGVSPIGLSASATSSLTVTFSVISGPGTISGTTLTVTGAGTIVVAANQAGNTSYAPAAEVQRSITVNQATPIITWATPAAITYGTALSATQLDAALSVAGGCTYLPAAGTVLGAGIQTLMASCPPTDTTDYKTPSPASVTLTVNRAPLILTASSASVAYGAAVPIITASYSGFVNGDQSSVLTTAPSCTTTYTTTSTNGVYPTTCSGAVAANYSISYVAGAVTVGLTSQSITFTKPATPVIFGVAPATLSASASSGLTVSFSASGVCAVTGGSLIFTSAGTCTVTASQAGNPNYAAAAAVNYTVIVNQAASTITWATPGAITYGTALSAAQLDATASVAGSMTYTAAPTGGSTTTVSSGSILAVGTYTLTATFTPTDTTDFANATASVSLTVNPTTAAISNLLPANASAGGAAFTLTVAGTNFNSGAIIYWGSTALTTTYVSPTQLTAAVTTAQIASEGIATVFVLASNGSFSNPLGFAIDTPSVTAPTFTPTTSTVTAGTAATYSVTLPTTASSVVVTCLNLPAGASCSYSPTTKAVTITTSTATPAGSYSITIVFAEPVTSTMIAGSLLPLLLLPLLWVKRKLRRQGAWLMVCLGVILLAGTTLVVGCGGASPSTSTTTTTQAISSGVVTLIVN